MPLGVWAAVRRGGLVDQVVRVMGLVGYSIPIFWLGLMALVVFYARLGWVSGPGTHRHRLRVHADARDGAAAPRLRARRGMAGVRQCAVASHPAGVAARLFLARLHQPHDALVHAERARAGIHRRGARQGTLRDPDHLAPRAAQRDGAARHRDRAVLRRPARRLGAHRNGLRVARARPLSHELAAERRHERGAGRARSSSARSSSGSTSCRTCSTRCSIRGPARWCRRDERRRARCAARTNERRRAAPRCSAPRGGGGAQRRSGQEPARLAHVRPAALAAAGGVRAGLRHVAHVRAQPARDGRAR